VKTGEVYGTMAVHYSC